MKCDGQDLDRDVAPQLAVARAIDLAHAARAERRDDRVRAELTADHLDSVWRFAKRAGHHVRRRGFEEPRRGGLVGEQRLDFLPEARDPHRTPSSGTRGAPGPHAPAPR